MPKKEPERKCETCEYVEKSTLPTLESDCPIMLCHRYPRIPKIDGSEIDGILNIFSHDDYPIHNPDDWCGEYKEKK